MASVTSPVHEIYEGAALVIGGTGGLGKAVCRGLASDWEAVSFTYRSRREEAQALERELSVHCHAPLHSPIFATRPPSPRRCTRPKNASDR